VDRVVVDGPFFEARSVLSVVISHYDGIDLPSIGQGFTTGRSDEEIDTFEEEVIPADSPGVPGSRAASYGGG
jgi:hypothetical protein